MEQIDEEELLEPWAEWIKRVTHRIEEQARKLNVENCVTRARMYWVGLGWIHLVGLAWV